MKNKPTKDGIPGEQRQVEEQLQVVLNIAEGSIPEVVGHIEVANRHWGRRKEVQEVPTGGSKVKYLLSVFNKPNLKKIKKN